MVRRVVVAGQSDLMPIFCLSEIPARYFPDIKFEYFYFHKPFVTGDIDILFYVNIGYHWRNFILRKGRKTVYFMDRPMWNVSGVVKQILMECDHVVCATEPLAQAIKAFNVRSVSVYTPRLDPTIKYTLPNDGFEGKNVLLAGNYMNLWHTYPKVKNRFDIDGYRLIVVGPMVGRVIVEYGVPQKASLITYEGLSPTSFLGLCKYCQIHIYATVPQVMNALYHVDNYVDLAFDYRKLYAAYSNAVLLSPQGDEIDYSSYLDYVKDRRIKEEYEVLINAIAKNMG